MAPDRTYHRVFLTGFSGTGKSSVAAHVAETLGWRALDTDALIEEAGRRSIAEIFAQDGEARFRELERDAVRRAAQENDAVIATGGGAPLATENRRAMASDALVLCLEARAQTIVDRLSDESDISERPRGAGAPPPPPRPVSSD